jgi:hypothetical protein
MLYSEKIIRWMRIVTICLASVAFFLGATSRLCAQQGKTPQIHKLGTIDLLMVETTPIVFQGRLLRFEYVRPNYPANSTGTSYFRFVDVQSGTATAPFAQGQHLGCAWVEGGTVHVFGVDQWGGSRISQFWSSDLKTWESQTALQLPDWGLFNTSVCKADGRYVMAIEVGSPRDLVGVPFTVYFAQSHDLRSWTLLPQECVYSREKYTACPALRYWDGYFYMVYLEALPGPAYETHVVRSRDLKHWQSSPLNPVLRASQEDKNIASPTLTATQRQEIMAATNINNSDVDFTEFQGRTIIYYSWGNQQGKEFLAVAEYEGTPEQLLRGFFP